MTKQQFVQFLKNKTDELTEKAPDGLKDLFREKPIILTILGIFALISEIPRSSTNEYRIAHWLMKWAEAFGFEAKMDQAGKDGTFGNTVFTIPASPKFEDRPTIVIQGHMDMVCKRIQDSSHNFEKDPIKFIFQFVEDMEGSELKAGYWLKADGTTLGADNGIAIAMAMALAMEDIPHPTLELFFTIDEESGLTGVENMDPELLTGKILINLDSEDEGVFTVGCAGGEMAEIKIKLAYEKQLQKGFQPFKLAVTDGAGAHSGIEIHKTAANAIKLLAQILTKTIEMHATNIAISDIRGGEAHNAIPGHAEAVLHISQSAIREVSGLVEIMGRELKLQFQGTDPKLSISLKEISPEDSHKVLTFRSGKKLVDIILAAPHGIHFMSNDVPGLVEASINFATIEFKDGFAILLFSQRSNIPARLELIGNELKAIARLSEPQGTIEFSARYPGWNPNMESPLLKQSLTLYETLFKKKPVVEIIHAGLEVGFLSEKIPGMDAISIGPDLKKVHSPDETLHIEDIGKIWVFMKALCKEV